MAKGGLALWSVCEDNLARWPSRCPTCHYVCSQSKIMVLTMCAYSCLLITWYMRVLFESVIPRFLSVCDPKEC